MSTPESSTVSEIEKDVFSNVERVLMNMYVLVGDIESNLKQLPKQTTDDADDVVAPRYIEVNNLAEQLKAGVRRFHAAIRTGTNHHAEVKSMPSPAEREDEAAQRPPVSQLRLVIDTLDSQLRHCLLCLAIFPPGEAIKKRLLIHLWLGEGIVKSADTGKGYFDELISLGLVQPALCRGHCRRTHYVRVHRAVHKQLVDADQASSKVDPHRMLLCAGAGQGYENTRCKDAFLTVYNLNMQYVETHSALLAASTVTGVLQLGRWKTSRKHHIELVGDGILENASACKNLRYLSLRGISLIKSIPEAVGRLADLLVLDLKACHNLEKLPGSIGSLQKLEYLDVSECFLLEEMPKEISLLSQLQVLKGFLVGSFRKKSSPCRLQDLATRMTKLRKLSITTGRQSPVCAEDKLRQLENCPRLESLTITWGGGTLETSTDAHSKWYISLPSSLTKLDLRRVPVTSLLDIIHPSTSVSLKKLYIRGGKLHTLGQEGGWKLETLRARFLSDLVCEWSELQGLFRELHFVEMWKCARLNFWPCDERGIWARGAPLAERSIGVCYGVKGDNLPPRHEVVQLYASNNIPAMRIFFPHHDVLKALRGTGIKISLDVQGLDVRRELIASFASNPSVAATWVSHNVQAFYPAVSFRYITVGNQVPMREMRYILPAMQNIYKALSSAGLDHIKVSTSVGRDVLGVSHPPSAGAFSSAMEPYIAPIVEFLASIGAPLMASVFPYFAYVGNQADIDINYALFTSPGTVVQDGACSYQNLFDAMVDALYSALEKVGGSTVKVVVSDSGWPSAGTDAATVKNATTYIQNLIDHVGKGTPKRPVPIETYIFAMFNENEKSGDDIERNFGLFYPDKRPVYPITFS